MAYASGIYSSPYLGSSPNTYTSPYQQALLAGIRKRRNAYTHQYVAVPDRTVTTPVTETPTTGTPGYREGYWADPELQNENPAAASEVNPLQSVLGPLGVRGGGGPYTWNLDTGAISKSPGYANMDWWPQWIKDYWLKNQQAQQQGVPQSVPTGLSYQRGPSQIGNALMALLQQRGVL